MRELDALDKAMPTNTAVKFLEKEQRAHLLVASRRLFLTRRT